MFFSSSSATIASSFLMFIVVYTSSAQDFVYLKTQQGFSWAQQLWKDFWPGFSYITKALPHLLLPCHFFIRSLSICWLFLSATSFILAIISRGIPVLSQCTFLRTYTEIHVSVLSKLKLYEDSDNHILIYHKLPDKMVLAWKYLHTSTQLDDYQTHNSIYFLMLS